MQFIKEKHSSLVFCHRNEEKQIRFAVIGPNGELKVTALLDAAYHYCRVFSNVREK